MESQTAHPTTNCWDTPSPHPPPQVSALLDHRKQLIIESVTTGTHWTCLNCRPTHCQFSSYGGGFVVLRCHQCIIIIIYLFYFFVRCAVFLLLSLRYSGVKRNNMRILYGVVIYYLTVLFKTGNQSKRAKTNQTIHKDPK